MNYLSNFLDVEDEEKKVDDSSSDLSINGRAEIKTTSKQGINGTVHVFETSLRRIFINEKTGEKSEHRIKPLPRETMQLLP